MRKWITFLMTFLVGSVSYVNANTGSAQINFEAGYRRDDLSWNVEVPECDPLFKISSKFENIDIFQIGLRARANIGCNVYARAAASWGWILDGDFEESFKIFASGFDDCGAETIEFKTQSENIIDDKFVADFDIAFGYPFYLCDCTMYLAPVIGYGFHEQNICIEDSDGIFLCEENSYLCPIEGSGNCCCQKQIFRWYGPFIGVDFGYQPCGECWNLWASLEYHLGRFKFKRHDFGCDPFDNFDTTSRHAHGWVFAAGADYDFGNCWTVGFSVKFQDWSATRRHHECFHDCSFDSTFFGSDEEIKTHASWRSFAVNFVVGYDF